MALLRLSNSRVHTSLSEINELVAPLQIGAFDLPASTRETVSRFKHPISKEDAMTVLRLLDPKVPAMVAKEGFTHRRVGNVVPSTGQDGSFAFVTRDENSAGDAAPIARSPKEIADYLIPHHVLVNDWHFVFSGGIIKGVQLKGDLQGVVYCQAGDWIRLNPSILNWPIFPYGEPTVAVSYFDRSFSGGPFKMDLHKEVPVKAGMTY
jgi:hypothetical protein